MLHCHCEFFNFSTNSESFYNIEINMECKHDSFVYRLSFLHYQHVKCIPVMNSKIHSDDGSFYNVIIIVLSRRWQHFRDKSAATYRNCINVDFFICKHLLKYWYQFGVCWLRPFGLDPCNNERTGVCQLLCIHMYQ